MSSMSAQRMNYLTGPPCVISGSLRSCASSNSSILSTPSKSEVHINGAFDLGADSSGESLCDHHEYASIKTIPAVGPRRKTNYVYEQAMPSPSLPLHKREINESVSDRSSRASSSSADTLPKKEGTYLSKFMVVIILVILAVSVAALVLVILTIFGTLGPKCGCTEQEKLRSSNAETVQSLLRRIQVLERNMLAIKTKMEARDSAVDIFVERHEKQVKFLQKQVSVQGRLINETASTAAFVNCSSQKKLSTEIKLLNKSVNALKNNVSEFKSTVSELRENEILVRLIRDRLTANVTQLQSRVQELRKSSENVSSRAWSLERGYARMNTEVKTLQAVNDAQNATHEALLSGYKLLEDSMAMINVTLSTKLDSEAAGNFNSCEYRMIKGAPSSPGSGAFASASYTEPPDKRVMGVTCSSDYAKEYKLEPLKKKGYYQCTCREGVTSKTSIHCFLHLWECPINT